MVSVMKLALAGVPSTFKANECAPNAAPPPGGVA
jgi:hypothetical protein